tara:strand:- start:1325 stop:2305 length:981 start_codon:yes stop_codon:yes gene_type:complete
MKALISIVLLLLTYSSLAIESVAPMPFAAADTELMIPVEGGKVYVRVNGGLDKGDIPVIFLHGGPGLRHNSLAGLLGLADERPVILYDQLDGGKSDQPNDPKNWRMERFILELEAIRKALGVDRFHIVGHSWGSAIALEYSVKYPQRVASTVLAGTFISTPHWVADANILVNEAPKATQRLLSACESNSPPSEQQCEKAFTTLYSKYYRSPPTSLERSIYDTKTGGESLNLAIYNGMWGPSEFSSTGTLTNYNAVPLLNKIDGNKTLFMIGQYDSARIDTVQDFVEKTPGAELAVIPGGAHGFLSDRPLISEAVLRSWFRRNEPSH